MGKLAELKVSIMRLAREVKKTIRKVNALEKIVIPDDEETIRFMRDRIEEAERESFILLKVVKDRMERARQVKDPHRVALTAHVVRPGEEVQNGSSV